MWVHVVQIGIAQALLIERMFALVKRFLLKATSFDVDLHRITD